MTRLASAVTKIEARRLEVARLVTEKGLTQQEMADILGVSRATISGDMLAIRSRWAQEQVEHIGPTIREELAKLDRTEAIVLKILERLDTEAQRGQHLDGPDGETVAVIVTDDVRLKANAQLLKIMERRAKYLGLDAPEKVDVSSNPLEDLVRKIAAKDAEDERKGK